MARHLIGLTVLAFAADGLERSDVVVLAETKVVDDVTCVVVRDTARLNGKDEAEVLRLGEQATVPFGRYDEVLVTRDFTDLDPDAVEHKFFAPGVGVVKSVSLTSGEEEVLVSMTG
ncbi:hypothetical protein [Sporichthya sp.]|uniref:hypothetical protein n=1 Tax=Sporichthya sp. TaxID=65475 RepID=UPI0017A52193|nr:hypothetical protein [Sporichthya sp.]MBA3743042.1 hypothetical protein [Sporichthya sp.]